MPHLSPVSKQQDVGVHLSVQPMCRPLLLPLRLRKTQDTEGFARRRLSSTPCGGAALPWNQWQLSRFMASFGDSKKRSSIYSACPRRGDQARVASDRLPRDTPETLLHSARLTYLTGVHASVAWQHCCGFGRKVTQQGQRALPTIIPPPPVTAPPRPQAARTSSPWLDRG